VANLMSSECRFYPCRARMIETCYSVLYIYSASEGGEYTARKKGDKNISKQVKVKFAKRDAKIKKLEGALGIMKAKYERMKELVQSLKEQLVQLAKKK
jgi:Zn-finger protein